MFEIACASANFTTGVGCRDYFSVVTYTNPTANSAWSYVNADSSCQNNEPIMELNSTYWARASQVLLS